MIDFKDIFDVNSDVVTAEDAARASSTIFVRSQLQLARDSGEATGRRLTAFEALSAFGLDALAKVAEDGGVGLVDDSSGMARTISDRRKKLRLSKRSLASAAGVTVDDVTEAETAGVVLPIRIFEKICQALALDERTVGTPSTKGDGALVTRLRELSHSGERDDQFIATLAEAAWVIGRQSELAELLHSDKDQKALFLNKSADYGDQIWAKGYELAERTRKIIGLDAVEPVSSAYNLSQDVLGIPVVEVNIDSDVAGATILNGSARGIFLNPRGNKRSIFVKRMTIAHELGHLLWDPADQLEKVRVDVEADINRRDIHDRVEARANAFAIALLAPRAAIRLIDGEEQDDHWKIAQIVEQYGIGPMAAASHLVNIRGRALDFTGRPRAASMHVIRQWEKNEKQENLITGHVPMSRGSRFALLTIQAARKKFITVDTAASWLKIDKRLLQQVF